MPEPDRPIDTDRLRTAVDAANLPTLAMVTFQLTGDERWLADPFRPGRGPGLGPNDSGGFDDATAAELKRGADRGGHRVVGGRTARSSGTGSGVVAAHALHRRRGGRAGRVRATHARGDGHRAGFRPGNRPGGRRPARRDHRGRGLRHRGRRAAAAGGGPVHDPRAPRRRRRRLAGQRLPGRGRRHPELPLLVLVRPARLVHPLRQARRDDRLPARRREAVLDLRPHRVRRRRGVGRVRGRPLDRARGGAGVDREGAGQRRRAVHEPGRAGAARPRGVRRARVPHHRVAARPGPRRAPGRRRRGGGERAAGGARDRRDARAPDRVPALPAVDRAGRGVLHPVRRRRALADAPRAVLPPLVPLPAGVDVQRPGPPVVDRSTRSGSTRSAR